MKHSRSSLPPASRTAQSCVAAAALALAMACGGSDPAPPQGPKAATGPAQAAGEAGPVFGPTLGATSSRGTFRFELRPVGGPIPCNEGFDVELALFEGESEEPFTGFDSVTLDARMPAHDHGMLRNVELEEAGQPGHYRADGLLFHMVGHWVFHVDVVKGPRTERAQASLNLEF